jgi:two-component system sensor histidine kinase/response regulator
MDGIASVGMGGRRGAAAIVAAAGDPGTPEGPTDAVLRQGDVLETEELLRAFMENSPAVAFMKDEEGRYVYLNGACRRRVVGPGADWIGLRAEDIFPPEVAAQLRAHDLAVLRSWSAIQVLEVVPDRDGRTRYWLSHKFPFRDRAGRRYVAGQAIDVTEREEAERSGGESRERLAAALAASHTGTYRWDIREDALVADEELCRLFGGDAAAPVAPRSVHEWLALIHPEDRPAAAAQCRRSLEQGTPFDLDFRVVWPDGSLHWLHDSGRVFRDERGEPWYMSGACTDVTDRKLAEIALAQSERMARATVDALSAQIAIVDDGGVIVDVNRAWQAFAEANGSPGTGGSAAGAPCGVGMNYLALCESVAGEDRETARAAAEGIRRVLAGGQGEFYMEYPCHSPTEQRWFALRVTRFAGGPPVRAVVAHENITARHNASALRREQIALKDAVSAMEQVLGVVGHELRTPLAGVRAMAEYVLTDGAQGTAEFDGFLHGIHEEVVRMAETVNNLLEAARLNSGKARWNWGELDVGEACREALDAVRPLVDAGRTALSLSVAPPAGVRMAGDADAVRRLVLNLLSNAHKHTGAGSIRVSVDLVEEVAGGPPMVRIEVADTGSGIAPEVREKLGQAFALNAGVVGRNFASGTGLGLAICNAIVAAHGGAVRVDSRPGAGTRMTVLLRRDLSGPREIGRDAPPVCEPCVAVGRPVASEVEFE